MEVLFIVLPLSVLTHVPVLVGAELPHISVSEFKQQQHQLQYLHQLQQQQQADAMILSNLELEPNIADQLKQARCVDPYRSIPMYGWRWFERE